MTMGGSVQRLVVVVAVMFVLLSVMVQVAEAW